MTIEEIIDLINKRCMRFAITKKELAEKAGISINTYRNFEKSKDIKLSTLIDVLKVVNSIIIVKGEDDE